MCGKALFYLWPSRRAFKSKKYKVRRVIDKNLNEKTQNKKKSKRQKQIEDSGRVLKLKDMKR